MAPRSISCPACKATVNLRQTPEGEDVPLEPEAPGKYTVCGKCATALRWTKGGTLETLTVEAEERMPDSIRDEICQLQVNVRYGLRSEEG